MEGERLRSTVLVGVIGAKVSRLTATVTCGSIWRLVHKSGLITLISESIMQETGTDRDILFCFFYGGGGFKSCFTSVSQAGISVISFPYCTNTVCTGEEYSNYSIFISDLKQFLHAIWSSNSAFSVLSGLCFCSFGFSSVLNILYFI